MVMGLVMNVWVLRQETDWFHDWYCPCIIVYYFEDLLSGGCFQNREVSWQDD
jgi:hypothetical protein